MEEIKFKSITDLYKRVFPALSAKKLELKREKITVTELELWNYLRKNKWDDSEDLKLYIMVNDIFEMDTRKFLEDRKNKLNGDN